MMRRSAQVQFSDRLIADKQGGVGDITLKSCDMVRWLEKKAGMAERLPTQDRHSREYIIALTGAAEEGCA